MPHLSRRRMITGAAAVAAALTLAACSSTPSPGASAPVGTTGAAAAPGGTRPFTDSLGRTVNVPAHPRRIVSLHEFSSGRGLLSIGAPVVGLPTREGKFSAAMQDFDLSNIRPVGDAFTYDIEKVASAEPDLIVALAKDKKGGKEVGKMPVADLEDIAPTVYLSQTATVDEYMSELGDLVGKQDEVARQKKEWNATLAQVKARYRTKLSHLSIAQVGSDEGKLDISSTVHPDPFLRVAQMLGVTLPKIAQDGGARNEIYVDVSREQLMRVSADVIFYNEDDEIARIPTWKDLPAVAAGQAVAMKETDFHSGPNYRSYQESLSYLDKKLSTARADVVDETTW